MNGAVGNSLAESEKMAAVSRLMGMGLAENAEKAAYLSKMAVMLGGETRTAGEAIDEFSLLLANQSVLRLDTFGISGARVRSRMEELQASVKGMSREAAFMAAVMETGAAKMGALEAAGVKSTTAANDLATAWKNLREEIGKKLAVPVSDLERWLAGVMQGATSAIAPSEAAQMQALEARTQQLKARQAQLIESSARGFDPYRMKELRDIEGQIKQTAAAMVALKAVTAQWGDVGVTAALRTGTAIKTTGEVVDEVKAKLHAYYLESAGARDKIVSGPGYVTSTAGMVEMGVFAQNSLIDAWLESNKVATKTINEQGQLYEQRMREASSKISGYVANAISASKGLFDVGGGDPFAPGKNGPFENVFRALDIAKNGAASPWAAKMNMDQETAKKLTGQFQQGLLTPEVVSKLINVDALKQQAQLQTQAEALTQAFSDSVAKAAGVDSKVIKSMFTTNPKQLESAVNGVATDVAKQLAGQNKILEGSGRDLILSISKGAESAKGAAVRSVSDITKAMIQAMQAALAGNGSAGAAATVTSGKSGGSTAAGAHSGASTKTAYIAGDSIQIVADSQSTAALAAAMIADKKRQKLDSFMGA